MDLNLRNTFFYRCILFLCFLIFCMPRGEAEIESVKKNEEIASLLEKSSNTKRYKESLVKRIRESATNLYGELARDFRGREDVYLIFTLSKSGEVNGIAVVEDSSTKNELLRMIAIKSVQEAAPFNAFPRELRMHSEMEFSIMLTFDASSDSVQSSAYSLKFFQKGIGYVEEYDKNIAISLMSPITKEFEEYAKDLLRKVYESLCAIYANSPLKNKEAGEANLSFLLTGDGEVEELRIISGKSTMDNGGQFITMAEEALQNSVPFGDVPAQFSNDKIPLHIRVSFFVQQEEEAN